MRLLNIKNDEKLDNVLILFTKSEAKEFLDKLEEIFNNDSGNHSHVNSKDYQKEVTFVIYDENRIDKNLSARVVKLIKEDK